VDSCEAITIGNHPPFVPCGSFRAPIAWGGGMVRRAGMEVKWWLGGIERDESNQTAMGSCCCFSPYCSRIVKKPISSYRQTLLIMQRFQ
jgi:hypothetical protein